MNLHSLPFSVGFNGPAEIDHAFSAAINNESNTFESAFRGRKLIGRPHELPQSLKISCVRFDKSAKTINTFMNSEDLKAKNCIIEWNKADLPEPSKFEITNFLKLTQLQNKINSLFD